MSDTWAGESSGYARCEPLVAVLRLAPSVDCIYTRHLAMVSAAPPDAPPGAKQQAARTAAFCNYLYCLENLERAKGLEPSTPTLARVGSRLETAPSQCGCFKRALSFGFSRVAGALASLQIP